MHHVTADSKSLREPSPRAFAGGLHSWEEDMDCLLGNVPWDLPDVDALELLTENSMGSVATGRRQMEELWRGVDVDVDLLGLAADDEESKASTKALVEPGVQEEGCKEETALMVIPGAMEDDCRVSTLSHLNSSKKQTQTPSKSKPQPGLRARLKRKQHNVEEQLDMLQQRVRAKTEENAALVHQNCLLENKVRMCQEESLLLRAQLREALSIGPVQPASPINLRQELGDHVHALCQVLKAPADSAGMTSFLKRLVSASTDVTIQLVLLSGHFNHDDFSSWSAASAGPLEPSQVARLVELVRRYYSEMESILSERKELQEQRASMVLHCAGGQHAAIFSAMLKNNLRKELNCFVGQIPILLQDILTPVQAANLIFSCYPSTVNPVTFAQSYSQMIQQSPESNCIMGYMPKILPGKVI